MATTKIASSDLLGFNDTTGAVRLPVGSTAQRPGSPSNSQLRYNSDTNVVEYYDGANWIELSYGFDPVTTNTLQFNGSSSPSTGLKDVIYRSTVTTSNRRTWTWSGWIKRLSATDTGFGNIWGASNFATSGGLNGLINCVWKGNGDLQLYTATGGGAGEQQQITATTQYTDTTKFHHIVFVLDTTNATSTDRLRIYFDGARQTVSGGYPAQNNEYDVNFTGQYQMVGQYAYASDYTNSFYGKMALIDFVDGQALDASYFGQGSAGSSWYPKTYEGSYGTNGYKFTFANTSALGTDTSGNGNNYSTNGVTSSDVSSESVPS